MRKRLWLFAVLALLVMLCACNKDEGTISTENPSEATASTTEPVQETPPSPSETAAPTEENVMYAGAMEDFMLPLDEHAWERDYEPEFVMLHFTSAVVNNRKDPFNIAAIREIYFAYDVSSHYIIERDGTIRCYIPENLVAWHAGAGEFGGDEKYTDKMNLYAIGIELVGIGTEEDMADYLTAEEYAALDDDMIGFTDEQYTALNALVTDICGRYSIPMDRDHVIGHSDYAEGNEDPGNILDWDKVLAAG